jgi:hypothetical protein
MRKVILSSCLIILVYSISNGQGWRGLFPAKSSCEDVKRILSVDKCNYPFTDYELDDFGVTVFFYEFNWCENCPENGLDIPKGTVTSLIVRPRKKIPLHEYGIDVSKFKKRVDAEMEGNEIYDNNEIGVTVYTFKGWVTDVFYFLSEKEKDILRCKKSAKPQM